VLAHQPSATDLLFITLRKNEALFSASAAGQRTIHHAAWGSRVLLFVRDQRRLGMVTEPFVCLGFARYESHEGPPEQGQIDCTTMDVSSFWR
jgi:hypothetical protein